MLEGELSEGNKVTTKLLNPLGVADSVLREVEGEVGRRIKEIGLDEEVLGMVREQCRLWGKGMEGEGGKAEGRCKGGFEDVREEGRGEI